MSSSASVQSDPVLRRGMGLLQATATNVISMVGRRAVSHHPVHGGGDERPARDLRVDRRPACSPSPTAWSTRTLGAALPGSGGGYLYLREAFKPFGLGPLMAFLFIFQTVLIAPLSVAGGAVGFGDYLQFVWRRCRR